MSNYLGLDYGDKHVGVAIAEGPLADPFATYDTVNAILTIGQLIKTYHIDEIVIGDCPEDFLHKLQELVVVNQVDETLSSHDAREALLHTTQKKRQEQEHEVSAALILQNWLDDVLKKV